MQEFSHLNPLTVSSIRSKSFVTMKLIAGKGKSILDNSILLHLNMIQFIYDRNGTKQ